MESFGNGVEQGLSDVKNAVSSYNDSQAQEVLDAFDAQFCTDASYTASSEKPLNFTGTYLGTKPTLHCTTLCTCKSGQSYYSS